MTNDVDADYYVYLHLRRDNGQPFYVGKGRWGRAQQKTNRTKHWRSVNATAGGFFVEFVAKGMTERAAQDLEWQKIAELKDLIVNVRKAPPLAPKNPNKKVVTLTLNAERLAQLRAWGVAHKRSLSSLVREAMSDFLASVKA